MSPMSEQTRTVAVVTAGLSQPSSTRLLADQLAAATARQLPAGTEVVTIELRDLAHDIVNNLLRQCRRIDDHGVHAPGLRDQRHDCSIAIGKRTVDGGGGGS